MFDRYHADIHRDGLIGEFKYLDTTDNFFWIPPGYSSPLKYDSVRKILEENAFAFTEIEFKWDMLWVFPLTPGVATYSGIVNSRMTDTTGVTSVSKIIESGTLIKRESGWKLLSGQSALLH